MKRIATTLFVCFLVLPSVAQDGAAPRAVKWLPFQEAVDRSESNGKMLLLDIYAPWCGWCQKMQDEVYTDQDVLRYLDKHFEIARLNIAAEDPVVFQGHDLTSQQLSYGLGAEGTPTTVFLSSAGEYITRLPGYMDVPGFLNVLHFLGTDAYEHSTFDEFLEGRQ